MIKINNNYFLADYYQKTNSLQKKLNIPYARNNIYNNSNLISTVTKISNNYPTVKQTSDRSFRMKKKILNDRNSYDFSKNIPNLYFHNTQKQKINEEINEEYNNDFFENKNMLIEDDKINYNNYYNYIKSDRSNSSEKSDDGEPDPRINFEAINQINKSRPLTSYGGLNVRKKNLKDAIEKYNSRPCTSYNINNNF